MQKVNTSESHAEASGYSKHLTVHYQLKEEIENINTYIEKFPDDKILPLLLRVAKLKLKIFHLTQKEDKNENITKSHS